MHFETLKLLRMKISTLCACQLFLAFAISFQTKAQTVELAADINPTGSSFANNTFSYNGEIILSAALQQFNRELIGFDGSTAYLIEEINPGTASSSPGSFTEFNNKVYFFATQAATGRELWSYDGSSVQIEYESVPGTSDNFSSGILTVFNGELYFLMDDGNIGSELYKYDGTNTPTLVADLNTTAGQGSNVSMFTHFNNELYFLATDANDITEIWHYDGTNAPSKATDSNFPSNNTFSNIVELNNELYFSYYDPLENTNHNTLFKCDGVNTNSLVPVMDAWTGIEPFDAHDLFVFNNVLYMVATNSMINYFNTWSYDGLSVPTVAFPTYVEPIIYNNQMYFSMLDSSFTIGSEIHRYDGVNSPVLLSDYIPGSQALVMNNPVLHDNKIYFTAATQSVGTELFVLDCNTDSTYSATACNEFVSPSGNFVWNATGLFQDTISNDLGCDSVITVGLISPSFQ